MRISINVKTMDLGRVWELTDGLGYSRMITIETEEGKVNLTLFADDREALEMPGDQLEIPNV